MNERLTKYWHKVAESECILIYGRNNTDRHIDYVTLRVEQMASQYRESKRKHDEELLEELEDARIIDEMQRWI